MIAESGITEVVSKWNKIVNVPLLQKIKIEQKRFLKYVSDSSFNGTSK